MAFKEGPQLLDFNLAFDQHSPEQAEAALRGGTLPYMAPEQLEAFLDPEKWNAVNRRADLYSLGLVLRELLTGSAPELPDAELKPARAIRDMLDRRSVYPPTLRHTKNRFPRALEAITERCLSYHSKDRYKHASELVEDLRRFLGKEPLLHVKNRARVELASNWVFRHRRPLVGSLRRSGRAELRCP